MSKVKVAVLTESPDDCPRTWPAVEYIMEPLESTYDVDRLSVLSGDPKNGKSATKTELRNAESVAEQLNDYDYVVLVGNPPLQLVTGSAGISKNRGRPFNRDGVFYLPINNPSVIKHDPKHEALLEKDLDLLEDMIKFGGIPEEKSLNIRLVLNRNNFKELLRALRGSVSFDIETNSLNPFQTHVDKKGELVEEPAKIVSLGFGTRDAQWIIMADHPQSTWSREELEEMVDEVTEVIEDCELVTHNGKFDLLWMWVHFGVRWRNDFDTMLAHYILDENSRHGLKYLAQVLLGAPDWEVGLETKQGSGSLSQLVKYHAHDLFYTRELKKFFVKWFKDEPDSKRVFDMILMPVSNLFVEVEYDGVYINTDQFEDAEKALRDQYDRALSNLEQWEPKGLTDSRGRAVKFNWGSSQQLADLLYNKLKLPVIEKTAGGNPSCSESVIKRLDHPCTKDLLSFRAAKQQLSFFIDGWKPYLHKRPNGYYLHPSFKLHGTVTGRLSCENPNLQQVPRDKRIRSLITAPEGWTLIECDLSQIELRIAAELADEQAMLYAFTHGIDIHWSTAINEIARGGGLKKLVIKTAKRWTKDKNITYSKAISALIEMGPDEAVKIDSRWKEFRKKAKAVNFGYLYGMWWKKFKDYARDSYGVHLTDHEAEGSRTAFFDKYKDLLEWHRRQKRFARKHGYVQSLSGRKRRLPAAKNRTGTPEGKAAERQAVNSPVQSFANDLNLMAALQLRSEYGRDKVRICGTVHDAVLFRVKNQYVEEVYHRMLEIMKRPKLMDEMEIDIQVPIEADGEVGPWGAGVSIEEWKEAQ